MPRQMRVPALAAVCLLLAATTLRASSQREWPSRVHFGVVAFGDRQAVIDKWKPLTEHLERSLGIQVKLITGPEYQRIIDLIATRKIDFAYVSPKAYVQASEQAHI